MCIRRIIRAAMLTGLLALTSSITSFAGSWQKDANGWWYRYNDGTYVNSGIYEIEGDIYIFDGDGYILTNTWFQSPNTGDWYYCQDGGQVAQNKWIGNYYCGSGGKMLTDTWVGDYYVGSDGKWIEDKKKETTSSGGASNLYSSAQNAKINNSSNSSSSSKNNSSFTKGWIYGFYDNVDQTGFNELHCARMDVYMDEGRASDAVLSFTLYDIAGHNYDLYDKFDPSGDILYGYNLGNYSQDLKSELRGDKFHMTYDGYDTIKLYWRDTTWLNETNNCIVFKKVAEYYPGRAKEITMGNNSYSSNDTDYTDSNSNDPFADRPINIDDSIYRIVTSDELETADIHVTETSY